MSRKYTVLYNLSLILILGIHALYLFSFRLRAHFFSLLYLDLMVIGMMVASYSLMKNKKNMAWTDDVRDILAGKSKAGKISEIVSLGLSYFSLFFAVFSILLKVYLDLKHVSEI